MDQSPLKTDQPTAPELLTTRELADLLRIKERKVYDLAASGSIPCSRALGKLLFPRDAVMAWLASNSSGFDLPGVAHAPAVMLGSHDPLLEWALRESQCTLASYFDGSADGIERFLNHEGIGAGLHLHESDGWNVRTVQSRCMAMPVVLVEWARRQRGLIVSNSVSGSVRGIPDLIGRRVVPRQAQAGAQALLLHLLNSAGIAPDQIDFTAPARSESDAVVMITEGKAEAAFGLQALADQFNLPFVPLVQERFDLLISRRAWFEPPMQKLLAFCRAPAFAQRASEMPGYDIGAFGTVHFNGV